MIICVRVCLRFEINNWWVAHTFWHILSLFISEDTDESCKRVNACVSLRENVKEHVSILNSPHGDGATGPDLLFGLKQIASRDFVWLIFNSEDRHGPVLCCPWGLSMLRKTIPLGNDEEARDGSWWISLFSQASFFSAASDVQISQFQLCWVWPKRGTGQVLSVGACLRKTWGMEVRISG